MSDTGIPYLTKTVNYVVGCDPVSKGCEHCWARRVATTRQRRLYGTDFTQVRVFPKRLTEMLRWRQPQRVGISMMGDLFHPEVRDDQVLNAFRAAGTCPLHDVLIFTKRAKRAADFLGPRRWRNLGRSPGMGGDVYAPVTPGKQLAADSPCLPNVIPIVSICNQHDADAQLPWLVKIPAARRMVSLEPLLERVDMSKWLDNISDLPDEAWDWCPPPREGRWKRVNDLEPDIHGIIVGCESGPGRRPMDPDWVRDLRDQAKTAGISFYLKQMEIGGKVMAHPELDGRTWTEFPERSA